MDNNSAIYSMLIDGLRLVASPFKVQCESLPDFVHVPDEILNAVENIYIPQLLKDGLITETQAHAFDDFEAYLDTFKSEKSYEALMKELELGEWFNELRNKAMALLDLLGEQYEKPKLDGITYIPGA